MKKYIFIYFLMAFAKLSHAQTIFDGTEKIDDSIYSGLYISIQSEKEFIEKDWQTYISKFGTLRRDKDNFIIKNALFEQISKKSMPFYSKIIQKHKYQSKLFVSIDSVNTSEKNRIFIEKMLRDYYQFTLKNEEGRFIENELVEAEKYLDELERKLGKNQRKFNRTLKNDEKISKNIDQTQVKIQYFEEKETPNAQAYQATKENTSPEKTEELEKQRKKLNKSITQKIENANKREQLLEDEAALQKMIQEAQSKLAEIQKNVSRFKTKQI